MKSYIIELRCDDDTQEKDQIILDAMKTLAKHAFTTACLIAGKRRPQISLRTSDMFVAEEEISLADDMDFAGESGQQLRKVTTKCPKPPKQSTPAHSRPTKNKSGKRVASHCSGRARPSRICSTT